MSMTLWLRGVVCLIVTLAAWGSGMAAAQDSQPQAAKPRVVLIGASIGQDWRLAEFPARVGRDDTVFESIAVWQFDKSDALDELLMRPKRRFHLTRTYIKGFFSPDPQPADIIILKECSAYFPVAPEQYKKMMIGWISEVRAAGKQAMVATAVPVTRARATTDKGKMEALREYNDWIRDYAKTMKLPLLALERGLNDGTPERFLRDDLTIGDGSHLNAKAYALLDQLLNTKMCELVLNGKCAQAH